MTFYSANKEFNYEPEYKQANDIANMQYWRTTDGMNKYFKNRVILSV